MDLGELCFHLRNRRRMYVGDDRFLTVAAFVEGYNSALGGRPLSGFNEYVGAELLGGHTPRHWSSVIAEVVSPAGEEVDPALHRMPVEVHLSAIHQLLDLLDGYRARLPEAGSW